MNQSENFITLNTGAKMPVVGLGTWNSKSDVAGASVQSALEAGYRHIDGAAIYRNEPGIGQVYKKIFSAGQIKREEVFITSKLWNTDHAQTDVLPALQKTLKDLQLDYLDLYLIHWGVAVPHTPEREPMDQAGYLIPASVPIQETWAAMEELMKTGLVKAVGISNFTAPMIVDLLSYAKVVPAVNQIELHPYNAQQKLIDFCHYKNIAVTAYSPIGSPGTLQPGEPMLLEEPVIVSLAQKHKKSAAQILIRWAIQRQTVVIPKSDHAPRIRENLDVFDFKLSSGEMAQISQLNRRFRYTNPVDWWGFPYFD